MYVLEVATCLSVSASVGQQVTGVPGALVLRFGVSGVSKLGQWDMSPALVVQVQAKSFLHWLVLRNTYNLQVEKNYFLREALKNCVF